MPHAGPVVSRRGCEPQVRAEREQVAPSPVGVNRIAAASIGYSDRCLSEWNPY